MPGPQPCVNVLFRFAPLSPHIVGRGLNPSACPFPSLRRGGIYAARNLPTVCRQSSSAHKSLHHQQTIPHHHPHPIICTPHPPSPQYTPCPNFPLKLCRKNQKNLQKPVDKGHTTCYNNQAVSRAQPAAAAAEAFTYSLYAFFEENFFKKLSENLLTILRI